MRIAVISIIAFSLLGFGVYFYLNQKNGIDAPESLSDTEFLAVVNNPQARVLVRGDINGDGYEDAIVEDIHCGASCGVELQIVFNENNGHARLFNSTTANFGPAYVGFSAAKSNVTAIAIKDGIISLTGKGLACTSPNAQEICTEEKWNIVRTVAYKFDGANIIQLSIEP